MLVARRAVGVLSAAAASTAPHRAVSSSVPLRALSASASEPAPAPATTVSSTSTAPSAIPGRRRAIGAPAALALASLSLATGYAIGRSSNTSASSSDESAADQVEQKPPHVLPSGLPRSCCSCESASSSTPPQLTEAQRNLPAKLRSIVGKEHVLSGSLAEASSAPYLKGARLGQGSALAIVKPQTIQEAIDCLQSIVDADCTVIPQGANTGLTGGSTPRGGGGDDSARPAVVMSMRGLDVAFPIDDGKRVVCLAGTGISDLSTRVTSWFPDRESHSVLGSIFLNPTTAAGVAYGSGGTQLRKGPARTDRALYAKVDRDKWGENVITVVNTLGIDGIEDADFQPGKGSVVEQLDMYARDIKEGYRRTMGKSSNSKFGTAQASDAKYPEKVCQDEGSVSRFNADTEGEDCNRSEGKVLILATVHDTFPKPARSKTYWVSFADLDTALAFRREVCLDNPSDLPVSVEYMDRDSFDVVDGAGRVMGNLIKVIGAGSIMGKLWQLKLWIEALPFDSAPLFCDKVLYNLNGFTPALLPSRIMDAGQTMDHHVAITIGEFGDGTLDRTLERMDKFVLGEDKIKVYECSGRGEETSLMAFRFVAAAAFRTWCVGNGKQGISIDYALPKNSGVVPALGKDHDEETSQPIPVKRMRYSHFGCNVVHEDLAYEAGVDVHSAKMALKKSVEHKSRGKLPAEHGHGTEYHAPEKTKQRWKKMDPCNVFNPGVGGLSTKFRYQE